MEELDDPRASLTMQVESSITTTPAEPSIEPAAASESKSMPTSSSLAGITGGRYPTGNHRLTFRPGRGPPACSSTSSCSDMPIGSS